MKAITFNSNIHFIKEMEMKMPQANVIMFEILKFNATWEGKHDDENKANLKTFLEKNAITSFYAEDIIKIFNEYRVLLFVPFYGFTIIREIWHNENLEYIFFTDENEMIYELSKQNVEMELNSMKLRHNLLKDVWEKMK